jgi:hypothetical protein
VLHLQEDEEVGIQHPVVGPVADSSWDTSTSCSQPNPPLVEPTNPADWHPVNRRQRKQRVGGAPKETLKIFSIFNKATWAPRL